MILSRSGYIFHYSSSSTVIVLSLKLISFNLFISSNLIKKLSEEWAEALNPIREELIELTDEFHSLNEQNQKLLKQALELNQISFETIMQKIKDEDTTYSKNNSEKKEQPRIINKQG